MITFLSRSFNQSVGELTLKAYVNCFDTSASFKIIKFNNTI